MYCVSHDKQNVQLNLKIIQMEWMKWISLIKPCQKVNQKLLLNEILKNSPISRAKLSEMTGLNKSTVSSQVNTLMKKTSYLEIGQGQSSGGRRPVMLVFNKKQDTRR